MDVLKKLIWITFMAHIQLVLCKFAANISSDISNNATDDMLIFAHVVCEVNFLCRNIMIQFNVVCCLFFIFIRYIGMEIVVYYTHIQMIPTEMKVFGPVDTVH